MKQRIIGALVLVSLAVIFVPMMFDEPHDERAVRSLEIPEEPPFPEVSIPETGPKTEGVPAYRVEELDRPGAETEATETDTTMAGDSGDTVPAESRQSVSVEEAADTEQAPAVSPDAEPATAKETTLDSGEVAGSGGGSEEFERTLAGAWVLQLGSFSNEENARRLRDSVRERGYGAHLQSVTVGDTRMVRVFSGPFTDEAEANKAKAVLDKAFNIRALVTQGVVQDNN